MKNKPRVLLLTNRNYISQVIHEHIDAIKGSNKFEWIEFNPSLKRPKKNTVFLEFDAIILHYTINPLFDFSLSEAMREAICSFKGPKLAFIQDEYRDVKKIESRYLQMELDVLFTLAPESIWKDCYPMLLHRGVELVKVLPGYVTDAMKKNISIPIDHRDIQIGYRTRPVSYTWGSHGHKKVLIADNLDKLKNTTSLKIDSEREEHKRLYGASWIQFMNNIQIAVGVEGGSSVWDYDGSIVNLNANYLKTIRNPSFQDFFDRYLTEVDGKIKYFTSSPRIFDAAKSKTLMINIEGNYDNIIQPYVHYYPIDYDLSNFNDIVQSVLYSKEKQEIVERTFNDIILGEKYEYKQLSYLVEKFIESKLNRSPQKTLSEVEINSNHSELGSREFKASKINRHGLELQKKLDKSKALTFNTIIGVIDEELAFMFFKIRCKAIELIELKAPPLVGRTLKSIKSAITHRR